MRTFARGSWIALLAASLGCTGLPVYQDNPATIGHPDYEPVFEATVRVLDRYFDIRYENRFDGRIETEPQAGATLFEPWLHDAVGFQERLEATLQTVRRRAFARIQASPTGGFAVSIEVYKELEDLGRPMFATYGGGTFIRSIEPIREELVTSAIAAPAGWISLGRDAKLEAKILDAIHSEIENGPRN